jgi:hypothetical protein
VREHFEVRDPEERDYRPSNIAGATQPLCV